MLQAFFNLVQKGQNNHKSFNLVGISISHDDYTFEREPTSFMPVFQAGMKMPQNKMDKIFVKFHESIQLTSPQCKGLPREYPHQLTKELYLEHVKRIPITLQRLVYFCLYSYQLQPDLEDRTQISLKGLAKMCE